tara:strand:+ start:1435 stop:2040 length:606 start_codon:yes stop_codon:yes gene_type:complete
MKNILFTLALLISFSSFGQSTSNIKSTFTSDLNKFYQFTVDRDYDKLFDLINPGMFNLISREQLAQVFEMTFDETISGMKFNIGSSAIINISDRFDFDGHKYYMIYYTSTMEMQILSEELLSNIENIKFVFENEYSQKSDSFEFDSKTNTFKITGLQQSMIASAEANTDNWKYIEYKTDSQSLAMMSNIIPAEVMKKLTKL